MLRLCLSKWRVQQMSSNNNLKLFINSSIKYFNQHIERQYATTTKTECNDLEEKRSFVDKNNVFHSIYGEVPNVFDNTSLHEYVWKDVDKWWNKIAVICSATGRFYTYKQLRKLSGRLATSLRKLNIKSGESIAAVLPNVPEYAIVLMGASEAKIPLTLVNPAYSAKEINNQLIDSKAVAVVTVPSRYKTVVESINGINSIRHPIIIIEDENDPAPSGTINFKDLVADNIIEFEKTDENNNINAENDTVVLPYSSGTTGLPKGVELTHRNIVSNLKQIGDKNITICESAIGDHQDIVPIILPAYHIYALTAIISHGLCKGAKLIAMSRTFTSNGLLEIFDKNKLSVIYLVPPILQLIALDSRFKKKHLENINKIICGAAPAGGEVMTKFKDKFGDNYQFGQGYGLSETSPVVSAGGKDIPWDSVGLLMPSTNVRIVENIEDGTQKNLGINEVGEILVKGPQVMKGYLNNPQATLNTMDGEWLKTGDLGCFDNDGNMWITGRLKELIKVKGFQVPPAELENILHGHEKIADVAVIGVPHEQFGETPKAFIVSKKDVKINEDEIKKFVAERVVDYKQLGQVVFIDQIPKSPAGKILRKELQIINDK